MSNYFTPLYKDAKKKEEKHPLCRGKEAGAKITPKHQTNSFLFRIDAFLVWVRLVCRVPN